MLIGRAFKSFEFIVNTGNESVCSITLPVFKGVGAGTLGWRNCFFDLYFCPGCL